MKDTKEQDDRITFRQLPGLHIDYSDHRVVHLVFDGFKLQLAAYYFDADGMKERGRYFRKFMAGVLQARYMSRSSHGGQDRSRVFCHLMAAKIYRKLRRLPQTEAWLLHRQ